MTKITLFIIILVVSSIILALLAFKKKKQLEARARRCAKESKAFHEKLRQLSDQSHFFTDEEAKQFKMEFAPLIDEVHDLYNNKLLSHDFLDDLGLRELIDKRKFLNHIQLENNRHFKNK